LWAPTTKLSSKMKYFATLLLAILPFLAAPPFAMAQAGPARAQLEQFADKLESLYAHFDQQVFKPDGGVEDKSSGQVWLIRPNRFRWQYGGDFPELVVADGQKVWLYDEMLEQVTIREQSLMTSDSPLMLLTDISRIDEQFEVRELGSDSGLHLLELRSHDPESEFERILLGLDNGELSLMAMEDAFGLRTEIRFREIQRNPALDEKLFQFTPPEGIDVIGNL
jgi:outer membrane lipoprotein carrier protein